MLSAGKRPLSATASSAPAPKRARAPLHNVSNSQAGASTSTAAVAPSRLLELLQAAPSMPLRAKDLDEPCAAAWGGAITEHATPTVSPACDPQELASLKARLDGALAQALESAGSCATTEGVNEPPSPLARLQHAWDEAIGAAVPVSRTEGKCAWLMRRALRELQQQPAGGDAASVATADAAPPAEFAEAGVEALAALRCHCETRLLQTPQALGALLKKARLEAGGASGEAGGSTETSGGRQRPAQSGRALLFGSEDDSMGDAAAHEQPWEWKLRLLLMQVELRLELACMASGGDGGSTEAAGRHKPKGSVGGGGGHEVPKGVYRELRQLLKMYLNLLSSQSNEDASGLAGYVCSSLATRYGARLPLATRQLCDDFGVQEHSDRGEKGGGPDGGAAATQSEEQDAAAAPAAGNAEAGGMMGPPALLPGELGGVASFAAAPRLTSLLRGGRRASSDGGILGAADAPAGAGGGLLTGGLPLASLSGSIDARLAARLTAPLRDGASSSLAPVAALAPAPLRRQSSTASTGSKLEKDIRIVSVPREPRPARGGGGAKPAAAKKGGGGAGGAGGGGRAIGKQPAPVRRGAPAPRPDAAGRGQDGRGRGGNAALRLASETAPGLGVGSPSAPDRTHRPTRRAAAESPFATSRNAVLVSETPTRAPAIVSETPNRGGAVSETPNRGSGVVSETPNRGGGSGGRRASSRSAVVQESPLR